MKVLFLTRSFYPKLGGVEKHVLKVSQELIIKGHEVSVLTELGGENVSNIKIYKLPLYKNSKLKKFRQWSWILKNRKIFETSDVIHCHDVYYWYFPIKIINPFIKSFVTFHGYETVYPPRRKDILIRRLSNFLATGSINVGEYIAKWYKTKADYTIYGGVEKQNIVEKFNEKNNILFIGRIEQDNCVDEYTQVLDYLKENNFIFLFEALGDGAKKDVFKKYGTVVGFKNNTVDYMVKAKIVFASSYLSILEALSQKKNVYALWNNKLKKDYLNLTPFKNYIYITSNPVEAAKDIIKNKYKVNNDGYKFAMDNTWDKIADVYLNLWNK